MQLLGAVSTPKGAAGAALNPEQVPLPDWAKELADFRHLLGCDGSQTLATIAVNGRVSLAIVDTGAHRTVMSPDFAEALGLKVTLAVNGNCGRFGVPGSGIVHDYAGVVADRFELRLGKDVKFSITGMKLLNNPFPLALLGADVLTAGRAKMWNYIGSDITEDGQSGVLKFKKGELSEAVPLY